MEIDHPPLSCKYELKELYKQKEYAHHIKCLSNSKENCDKFIELRKLCKKVRNQKLGPLLEWCAMNRMDINWSKTFFMIVTAKQKRKISVLTFIKVGSNEVAVTDNFTNICINVNRKLFTLFDYKLVLCLSLFAHKLINVPAALA